jgi:metal-responsive CopG/Arc/MetJ family transcriptional regulator
MIKLTMKKEKKVKIYFSLDAELNDIFQKHIEDNIIDRSKLVAILIRKYLEEIKLIEK